jgi:hypothetical protein
MFRLLRYKILTLATIKSVNLHIMPYKTQSETSLRVGRQPYKGKYFVYNEIHTTVILVPSVRIC